MRNITSVDPPNLFTPGMVPEESAVGEDSSAAQIAREFVKWCWSVGDDFHNSPDRTNLQFWMDKNQDRITSAEEDPILKEARRLYLKKVEQAVRKPDGPKVAD